MYIDVHIHNILLYITIGNYAIEKTKVTENVTLLCWFLYNQFFLYFSLITQFEIEQLLYYFYCIDTNKVGRQIYLV